MDSEFNVFWYVDRPVPGVFDFAYPSSHSQQASTPCVHPPLLPVFRIAYPSLQTLTVVLHFFLAMSENPEAMVKAQKEIDSVVGNDRLPTFADRKNLPYVEALFNECFRHGVPVPLCMSLLPGWSSRHPYRSWSALPHRLMEDDIYEGAFIPKGTLVFANIWCVLTPQ